MEKLFLSLVSLLILTACQGLKTRSEVAEPKPPPALAPTQAAAPTAQIELAPSIDIPQEPPPPKISWGQSPQIGIIFGPGGLRGFAHVGVLQELHKAKIPIHSVAGIEMGSLVAALFANKAQVFDVEWQMMKLKEDDIIRKGFMSGGQATDVRSMNNFLRTVFAEAKAEDARLPFVCPAWNLSSRQAYMMSRGPFTSMLPYCLPLYPVFKPYNQNIAGVGSLSVLAKHLRTKGANYLIYVSVLGDEGSSVFGSLDSPENVSWNVVAQGLEGQLSGFNYVVRVPLEKTSLTDFNKRREVLQKGQTAGRTAAAQIVQQLGL